MKKKNIITKLNDYVKENDHYSPGQFDIYKDIANVTDIEYLEMLDKSMDESIEVFNRKSDLIKKMEAKMRNMTIEEYEIEGIKHLKDLKNKIEDKIKELKSNDKIVQIKQIISKSSVPVTNNPKILQWLVNNQTDAYKNNKKCLSANLVEEMTKVYGKQNTTLTLEFRMKLWVLKYKNLTFNVYTAPGKGTSIELCDTSYEEVNSGKYEKEIIEFLEELYHQVNNH